MAAFIFRFVCIAFELNEIPKQKIIFLLPIFTCDILNVFISSFTLHTIAIQVSVLQQRMCLRLKHILYILQQVYKMNCMKICLWHKPCANKIGFCNKVIIYFNVNIPLGNLIFYNNVLCTNMLTELKEHLCFRIPFLYIVKYKEHSLSILYVIKEMSIQCQTIISFIYQEKAS